MQRISQLKQDSERKARNLEQQLNEGNAVRAAQDEKISKLESSTNKLQKECDQLTNQIEEIETKAANLDVSILKDVFYVSKSFRSIILSQQKVREIARLVNFLKTNNELRAIVVHTH